MSMPDRLRHGRDGLDGVDGASAFEIAKALGFQGEPADWLRTLKGDRGADGQPVPMDTVKTLVDLAVAEIPIPKDGPPGIPGKAGERGLKGDRGERGERGPDGKDSKLPPIVPWRADYERDLETRLVTRVRAGAADGSGQFITLIPKRGDDLLIEYIDLIPEPA